ncbi:MAG TPA: GNAT family N-acetyltransferase [Acidobacteriaceae bacterium]|nr:GNAT family N-acetyltransferase [Acidobacteriaceae bacterium]
MEIREAVASDFGEITAIYNEVLTHSTAIYSDRPATVEDRLAWWRARQQQGFPVLVATEGTAIKGFATFGDFRSWPGYRFTVEGTIHIHASARGQGIGKALLAELIRRATALGKHTMIAGVDSENQASIKFLQRAGFVQVAHLREVGYKFDRYLDLIFLQYFLTPPAREAPNRNPA